MKQIERLTIALLLLLVCGCTEDNFTPPAFLHVEAIDLEETPSIITGEHFYTSDIVAAYVLAYYEGERSQDTLGLYRLPFTVPVLFDGKAKYIEIFPAVEQSGISGALPYYTFYSPIHLEAADSTTFHTLDTLNLGTLTTRYRPYPLIDTVQLFEPFERPAEQIRFDTTLHWMDDDEAGACTGKGYGRLHFSASEEYKKFTSKDVFYITDPSKVIYLEMDIRSEIPLQVFLKGAMQEGAADQTVSVMTINPIDHWQHLYINLGKTWTYMRHPKNFQLVFAAFNEDHIDGNIDIDNVKLISTSISL